MSVALAAQLREGTKKSHTMAENTGFVSCFLKGVVDKASYRKLVADLYFVYTAMEEEIAKLGDHPVVGPLRPELFWVEHSGRNRNGLWHALSAAFMLIASSFDSRERS